MRKIYILLATTLLLAACGDLTPSVPKPTAYMRFDFPESEYAVYDTAALPFTFEKATAAQVSMKKDRPGNKWVDITYPAYNGVIFLTYKSMHNASELAAQVDTAYEMLTKHFDFSSGIDEKRYTDTSNHVIATTYWLKGRNTASTYQFWATDSSRHFLRGSLYLDCTPNNDSLAPVLDYLQKDIRHMVETLRWR